MLVKGDPGGRTVIAVCHSYIKQVPMDIHVFVAEHAKSLQCVSFMNVSHIIWDVYVILLFMNENETFVCILIRWHCQITENFTNLGQGFVNRTTQISWSLMAWWQGNGSNSIDLFLWNISVAEPEWLTWRTICQLTIIVATRIFAMYD